MKKTLLVFALFCATLFSCNKQESQTDRINYPTINNREKVVLRSGIVLSKINNTYFLQNDIRLTPEQIKILDRPITKSAVYDDFVRYWLNGIVYYSFSPTFPNGLKEYVMEAISDYENNTPITFIASNNSQNYVEFIYDPTISYCKSDIGMIGGRQTIDLGLDFKFF